MPRFLLTLAAVLPAADARKPNTLLILADDRVEVEQPLQCRTPDYPEILG